MSDWAERIAAAHAAGVQPAYADLEEGLSMVLQELHALQNITKQMGTDIAKIVLARTISDTPAVLAAVDDVIKKSVIVKQHQNKASMH